jgi:hypothetical protein
MLELLYAKLGYIVIDRFNLGIKAIPEILLESNDEESIIKKEEIEKVIGNQSIDNFSI